MSPLPTPHHPAPDAARHSRLAHFPITFFATTMGLGGLTLALRAGTGAVMPVLWQAMLALTAVVFLAIVAVYLAKALRHPGQVAAEWAHPARMAFFPTISVSLLLMASGVLMLSPPLATAMWWVGTALQGALTLAVVAGWIGTRAFQHGVLSPAWFIPAVGNVIVPVAGAPLGHLELSWLFFSAGLMFWLILLTLVFNRLVFHDPLPARLQPTLVILIAPPAVAFIAWMRLRGAVAGVDAFGHILLSLAYVFAAVVATQLPRILRLPFAMSFWALSFPLAALTIATFLYAEKAASPAHHSLGMGLLVVLVGVIVALVIRTLRAMAEGEVCVPE